MHARLAAALALALPLASSSARASPPEVVHAQLRALCHSSQKVLWTYFHWTNRGLHEISDHTWGLAIQDLERDQWTFGLMAAASLEDPTDGQWRLAKGAASSVDLGQMIKAVKPTSCTGFDGNTSEVDDTRDGFFLSVKGQRLRLHLGGHALNVAGKPKVMFPALRVKQGQRSIQPVPADWPDCAVGDTPTPCRLRPLRRIEGRRSSLLLFAGRPGLDEVSTVDQYVLAPRRDLDACRARLFNLSGLALHKQGKKEQADKQFARAMKLAEDSYEAAYDSACVAARLGKTEAAMKVLELHSDKVGLKKKIEGNPDFAAARRDPAFARFLAGLK